MESRPRQRSHSFTISIILAPIGRSIKIFDKVGELGSKVVCALILSCYFFFLFYSICQASILSCLLLVILNAIGFVVFSFSSFVSSPHFCLFLFAHLILYFYSLSKFLFYNFHKWSIIFSFLQNAIHLFYLLMIFLEL